jgi:23S rRNA pseudouridine2605 synthase
MGSDSTRLNKLLALHLGISRREADIFINDGRVTVNESPAVLGQQVKPSDTVELDGKPVGRNTHFAYIALNKPIGYVCSRQQQGDVPTVYSLLPSELHELKLVGRLDKDSSGLILLTNDGDFAHKMTHPSFHKTKTYEIALNKNLEPLHQQLIQEPGIDLDDGKSQLRLKQMEEKNRRQWRVLMHEGRNRQIRRTFEALGYHVTKLHRTQFGAVSLQALHLGLKDWKKIELP